MDHIQDLLSGGGNQVMGKLDNVSYYMDEARVHGQYKLNTIFRPVEVCPVESKIYDFIKKEGIEINVSPMFRCEGIVITENGFISVVMPCGAERKDQLDRLVALAHEVGHYLDLKYNYSFDTKDFNTNGDKVKERTKEMLAWQYAYDILSCYGFTYWEEFLYKMKDSFMSYFKDDESIQASYYINRVFDYVRNKQLH